MRRHSRGGTGRWEVAVAILGALSSVLLVVLALAPSNDPELAGRTAFSKLAGEVEDAVAAEWERALADPMFLQNSTQQEWSSADEAYVASRLEMQQWFQGNFPQPVFEVLLAEAERLEAAGDPAEARKAALEALAKTTISHWRARAALVAIRCARQAEKCAEALETWRGVREQLSDDLLINGVPEVLACGLAAAPCLEPEERAELQRRCKLAWEHAPVAAIDPPLAKLLLARVEALAPGEVAGQVRELARLQDLVAFAQVAPQRRLPARPEDTRWHLEAVGASNWLAWRATGVDQVVATRLEHAELVRLFTKLAKRSLPAGFALDLGLGDVESRAVREPRKLGDGELVLTLRHEDPDAAMRAEGTRVRLLRAALLFVAVLSGLASVATWRAMRRSRRLSGLKSSFVASVSHELRTPVASILMLAENLEEGRVSDAASRARYASLIRREAERLRRLVADVLDFSRLERGRELDLRREGVEIGAFVAELAREAVEWAKSHSLELAVEIAPLRGHAQLDSDAVRRALANLLDNARKHSGSTELKLAASTEGRMLRLVVSDRGRGVPAEQREKLFEPFERLEASNGTGGAGLGLAIVREIAREHGGRVRFVEPDGGVGARVELELPLEEGT